MKTKPKYIGIDVGGTKILIQAFDRKLNAVAEKMVKTDTTNGQKGFYAQLLALIDELFHKNIEGIGVALPGIVRQPDGVLIHAPHLPTGRNFRLKSLLEKRYKVPVHADNDINAFLMAESQNPRLSNAKTLVAVMVGTGVGGAMMMDGKIVYGKDGYAGEFGHMIINLDGKSQTLEELVGGFYKNRTPKLHKSLVDHLGIGLSNLNLVFNPEVIVLGGSVYLNHISSKKAELRRIIKAHSLAKKCPKLVDALDTTSVAKGAVFLGIGDW